MNRSRSIWLVVVLAALVVGWGFYRLFELRFAAGDVYPPYSTYRADPLGARALFEGFALLPERQTQRLLEDLNRLESGRDTTLFVLGVDASLDDVEESEAQDLERFMQQGGRIVMSFFPEKAKPHFANWRSRSSTNSPSLRPPRERNRKPATPPKPPEPGKPLDEEGDSEPVPESMPAADQQNPTNAPPQKAKAKPKPKDAMDEFRGVRTASLRKRWGFEVDYEKLTASEEGVIAPVVVRRTEVAPNLPSQLDWHSAAYFTATNQGWRAAYLRDRHPVVMERNFGKGTLVLASDSWFTSNEALRKDRQTQLLSWLAGSNHHLVFDETHLGIELEAGISMLAVRYRLHGLFASLLLLAALFVWKNATSFVPPHEQGGPAADIVSGKDSASGFVNLLRRSIAPRNLLAVCFAEWQKSGGRQLRSRNDRLARMNAVVEAQSATPVDGYRELSRILKERGGHEEAQKEQKQKHKEPNHELVFKP